MPVDSTCHRIRTGMHGFIAHSPHPKKKVSLFFLLMLNLFLLYKLNSLPIIMFLFFFYDVYIKDYPEHNKQTTATRNYPYVVFLYFVIFLTTFLCFLWLVYLIYLCGDVELNPGPPTYDSDFLVSHSTNFSKSQDKKFYMRFVCFNLQLLLRYVDSFFHPECFATLTRIFCFGHVTIYEIVLIQFVPVSGYPRTDVVASKPSRKSYPSVHSKSFFNNITMFVPNIICSLPINTNDVFLYVLYKIAQHLISLSGDIEINPGPAPSVSSSSSDSSILSSAYTTDEISLLSKSYFSIVNFNIQSLLPKIETLQFELLHHSVLVFTETWLKENDCSHELEFPGFQSPFHRCRSDRPGGGVSIYVKDNVHVKRRQDLELPSVESVWVELHVSGTVLLLGAFYRPPNSPSSLWQDIEHSIDLAFSTNYSNIVITGDLNVDYLKQNPHSRYLTNIITNYNLVQMVTEPTHYTTTSNSLIDLVLVNTVNFVKEIKVGENFLDQPLRYHCPIYCFLYFPKIHTPSFKRQIWLYDRGDYNKFRDKLRNIPWVSTLNKPNLEESVDAFNHVIFSTARECIPHKYVTIRQSDPPWMCNNVRKLIRKRRRLYGKAKSLNTVAAWDNFKSIRNKCVNSVRQAKSRFYNKLSAKLVNVHNQRDWWKIALSLMDSNSSKSPIPIINHEGRQFNDDDSKAEAFNTYFCSQSVVNDTGIPTPAFHHLPQNTIDNITITEDDIKDAISCLDITKAVGPDLMSPRFFKEASHIICYPLSILFNKSLSNNSYPDSWKKANVTPIHKKSDRNNIKNYRPISLLSLTGKLMERCVYKHVYNFLTSNNIITSHQSGFVAGDSTVNQLLSISHDISKAIDNGKEVRAVFCDVSKAFDRVWHRGLLCKLSSVGISGNLLSWFGNYLSNRKQRVVLNGSSSRWLDVNAGVPQGSILGPLLFLIYINDIVENIQAPIKLFADDTTLYIIVDTPMNAFRTLQNDLLVVQEWASKWLVDFNPNKTESLVVSKKVNKPPHPVLLLNNTPISEVTSHQHLGVTMSSNADWKQHVDNIITKTSYRISIFRKLKFRVDRRSLHQMYLSFIRPLLEYADVVWDNLTLEYAKKLESIQLEALRIICGATKLASHDSLYHETGIEPLCERRRKHKIIQFHKIIHGLTPNYLSDILPNRIHELHDHNTRQAQNVANLQARTTFYNKSFFPFTINLWNSLPFNIKVNPSISVLKLHLNAGLLQVPKYYFEGKRPGQVYHARLRLKCSSLRDHLFRRNLIDDPFCTCGQIETTNHYLFECAAYSLLRRQYIYPIGNLSLDLLLHGDPLRTEAENTNIFKAVQSFIVKSKRFEPT